jgi:hypothetical protein
MLDAEQGFGHYLWSTGDTTSYMWVKNDGGYWVNFTSGDTINETDTTWVFILDAELFKVTQQFPVAIQLL